MEESCILDEINFNIVRFDGQMVLEGFGEPLRNHVVSKIAMHRGRSIMIWSCMSWKAIGKLTRIEGHMNSKHC